MLVLTRKSDESLVIGDRIVVKVLEIRGKTVKLGIEADPSISIRRSEILPVSRASTDDERISEAAPHILAE